MQHKYLYTELMSKKINKTIVLFILVCFVLGISSCTSRKPKYERCPAYGNEKVKQQY